MLFKLVRLKNLEMWVIKVGNTDIGVCYDDDLKALSKQLKEAGF